MPFGSKKTARPGGRKAVFLIDASPDCDIGRELREIIDAEQLRVVLQPVVDLRNGSVRGYEALARGPRGSRLESPDQLFSTGRRVNLLFALEQVCRRYALLAKRRFLSREEYLFLNVEPEIINEPRLQAEIHREVLSILEIEPGEVVLELTERMAIDDYSRVARAIEGYIDLGFKVAVDDLGAGYANLRLIAEVRPDFIKVDMTLIRGIDGNPRKQALLETLSILADKVDARLVAEGVETDAELRTLASLGADYAQGFYLARPEENPPRVAPSVMTALARPAADPA